MSPDKPQTGNEHYACLVALGDDRVGLVHQVTSFLLDKGISIASIRTATLGSEFALLAHCHGTSVQIDQIRDAVPQLQSKSGLSVLFRRSKEAAPAFEEHAPTHDVFVAAYDAAGIVSELTAVLARHGVNVERLGGDVYPAPNQGVPLFTIHASVRVPGKVAAATVGADLEALRERCGWADADIAPHGKYDTSAIAEAPSFPPAGTWKSHATDPSGNKA